jgi:hypothetical protein
MTVLSDLRSLGPDGDLTSSQIFDVRASNFPSTSRAPREKALRPKRTRQVCNRVLRPICTDCQKASPSSRIMFQSEQSSPAIRFLLNSLGRQKAACFFAVSLGHTIKGCSQELTRAVTYYRGDPSCLA